MNIEEIVVTITKDGRASIQTNGFTGTACTSATQRLEELLGNEIIDRTMTDEAYQTGTTDGHMTTGQSW